MLRRSSRSSILLALALFPAACTQGVSPHRASATGAPYELAPRPYDQVEEGPISLAPEGVTRTPAARSFYDPGTGDYTKPQILAGLDQNDLSGPRNITLNFSNADVREVVRSVLGDTLRLPYVVDPAVQGAVTLQTAGPVAKGDALLALQNALRLSGIALIRSQGLYRVVPIAAAAGEATIGGTSQSGFNTRIITLRYVAAADVEKVLQPLLPPSVSVRADNARNILIVTGASQDIEDVVQKVDVFDVDYLRGLSFALLPLENAQAAEVAKEVTNLLAAPGSVTQGLVRVTPVERLNALLVTAVRPVYLARVAQWVRRLDQATNGDSLERKLFVYRVQNGRASDLAAVLKKILTGGGDESTAKGGPSSSSSSLSGSQVSGVNNVPDALSGGLSGPESGPPPGSPLATPGGDQSTSSQAGRGDSDSGDAMPGVRITADDENNAIIVLSSNEQYATIQAALRQLDRQPLQVLIQATVAEVTLTDQLTYGLQYAIQSGNFQGVFSSGSQTSSSTSSSPAASALPIAGSAAALAGNAGLGLSYVLGASSDVVLQLLQSLTKVRVLSSPNLLVLNNQSAQLQVGDQVPISTETAQSTLNSGAPLVSSIEYRDTGVILKVTPRVNANGLVLLDVDQEVSNVSTTTTSTLNTPTISQRRVNSSIAIADGQTIALAGLISDTRSHTKSGIPLLQDIPYLGALFSITSNSSSRNELIVLITPHVVRNSLSADAVTQELRQKLPLTVPVSEDRH